MVIHKDGNMFDFEHDCYVNTINCRGAMGAGIAKEFRDRFPFMYEHYRDLCAEDLIAPGDCWRYEDVSGKLLLGLAVKFHWKNRIRISWAKMAVRNMTNDIRAGNIKADNIALPRIGSKNGGRGAPFAGVSDNWPEDSELGYSRFESFLLSELNMLPNHDFTIYRLT